MPKENHNLANQKDKTMKTPSRTMFIIEHCLVGASLFALTALCGRHGEDPSGFVKEWAAGLEVWPHTLLRIVMMAVLASLFDLLSRYFTSAVSGTHDHGAASQRKSAAIRMAVIAVHIVCVAIALVIAPKAFPCTSVWKGMCLFGAMLVPLAVAYADLRKATTDSAPH